MALLHSPWLNQAHAAWGAPSWDQLSYQLCLCFILHLLLVHAVSSTPPLVQPSPPQHLPAGVPCATCSRSRSPTEMCTRSYCTSHSKRNRHSAADLLNFRRYSDPRGRSASLVCCWSRPAAQIRAQASGMTRWLKMSRQESNAEDFHTFFTICSHCVPFPAAGAPAIITRRGLLAATAVSAFV
jgi:hypothetical protein